MGMIGNWHWPFNPAHPPQQQLHTFLAFLVQVAEGVFQDVQVGWWVLLAGFGIAMVISFIWILLLRFIASFMIWFSIVAFICLSGFGKFGSFLPSVLPVFLVFMFGFLLCCISGLGILLLLSCHINFGSFSFIFRVYASFQFESFHLVFVFFFVCFKFSTSFLTFPYFYLKIDPSFPFVFFC